MKIFVTGCEGQLGRELQKLSPGYAEHSFVFTDLPQLDICDKEAVDHYIKDEKPDILINCAAYTAVDKAETEPEKAWQINRDAVQHLAIACDKNKCFMIHVSTDYVFDGKSGNPYKEEDATTPLSVYGSSKLQGEIEVIFNTKRAIIIRTSWLYSSFGNNFVRTMLRLGSEQKEIKVVADQVGCPTYARDLAKDILKSLPLCTKYTEVEVYHYANSGVASWFDFAKAIFEMKGMDCKVIPITTAEFPVKARRPAYTVLNTRKFRQHFSLEIPYWKDSLKDCLTLL